MRGNRRSHVILSWGMALLLSAIATATLWHAPHPNRAEPGVEETHAHSGPNVALCAEITSPNGTECTLCLTKRLLSSSVTNQVHDTCSPPLGVRVAGEVVLGTLRGDRFHVSTRAPPLS